MLARLAELEMAVEITGRGSHKLYALPDLADLRSEVRRPLRRWQRTAAQRPDEPESLPPEPGDIMVPAGRPFPLPAPQADLATAIAALDEPLRRVQATLKRLAAKEHPASN
jgi:hypothetical protein